MAYTNTNPEGGNVPSTAGGGSGNLVNIGANTLNSLLNMGQSMIDRKTQRESDERTINANKELAAYSYSKDLEMWNRQNQYNTPSGQMDRIRAAGLNPNLIYGSGQVTGNTSGNIPKYNTPRADYHDKPIQIGGLISDYQDARQKTAQTDNVRSQTNLANEKAATEAIEQGIKGKELGIKGIDYITAKKLAGYNYEAGRLAVEQQQTALEKTLTENKKLNTEIQNNLTKGEILELEKSIKSKENEWIQEHGIRPTDPIIYRWIAEWYKAKKGYFDVDSWKNEAKRLKYFYKSNKIKQ